MRTFFRVINAILLVAALIAAGACFYFYYSYTHYPVAEREAELEALRGQISQTQAETQRALEETEARAEALKSGLNALGEEGAALSDSLEQAVAQSEEKSAQLAELRETAERSRDIRAGAESMRKEYAMKIRELEEKIQRGESSVKICYWTLDDGPTYITANFLDALDAMDNVHVTFFTANKANDSPDEEEILRREMLSGHSVQNHSYGHVTDAGGVVYRSLDSFREQVQMQDDWLCEVTGFRPGIFRFPGGYYSWGQYYLKDAINVLDEMGYKWVDWNCNLYDAGAAENLPSAALEISRALNQISEKDIAIILGHDWNMNTLVAMKSAIPQLQEKGYVFLPLFPESVTMNEATVAV